MISDDKARELIDRRRRQLHVHSVLYYHMHTNLIDDAVFDKWALELASLQRDFPQFKHEGYKYVMFENWTGDTGMHLLVTDEVHSLAKQLLRLAENKNHTVTPTTKKEAWKGDVGYQVN